MLPSVTIQKYYIIIDYIPHTVHFIPLTHLFCNWRFALLNLPHWYLFSLHFTSPWQLPVCSLYLWLCFCLVTFVRLFCFLGFAYKWDHFKFPNYWTQSCLCSPWYLPKSCFHWGLVFCLFVCFVFYLFVFPPVHKIGRASCRERV